MQRECMFRKLTAIEIAEGALLADIGIIFQLLAVYIPIGKTIFHILTPIVFAIIVLRRGFYVGTMSLAVALFVISIFRGPGAFFNMLLECGAGLFLGLTMRHRMRHYFIIFVGTTCGAGAFYLLLLLFNFLSGLPITDLVKGLHGAYQSAVSLVGLVAASFGLTQFWQHSLFPVIDVIANLAFTYWWAAYYILNWVFLLPVVIVVYYVTNLFVRRLGYPVRPFPSGALESLQYWILRTLTRLIPERGIGKHWLAQTLRREVRRLGIARHKSSV